jgi:hypothetical protein
MKTPDHKVKPLLTLQRLKEIKFKRNINCHLLYCIYIEYKHVSLVIQYGRILFRRYESDSNFKLPLVFSLIEWLRQSLFIN